MYFNVFKTILGLQLGTVALAWRLGRILAMPWMICPLTDNNTADTWPPLSNRLEVEWLIQEEGRNKPNDYNITFNIIYKHCYIICCFWTKNSIYSNCCWSLILCPPKIYNPCSTLFSIIWYLFKDSFFETPLLAC